MGVLLVAGQAVADLFLRVKPTRKGDKENEQKK
jgi:hypothetical protein